MFLHAGQNMLSDSMKILKSLLVWVCFIPAAILNGGLREHVLARALGEKWALPLSGIILSVCIFLITWLLLPRTVKAVSSKDSLQIGICWVFLTIAFEFVSGLGWRQYNDGASCRL